MDRLNEEDIPVKNEIWIPSFILFLIIYIVVMSKEDSFQLMKNDKPRFSPVRISNKDEAKRPLNEVIVEKKEGQPQNLLDPESCELCGDYKLVMLSSEIEKTDNDEIHDVTHEIESNPIMGELIIRQQGEINFLSVPTDGDPLELSFVPIEMNYFKVEQIEGQFRKIKEGMLELLLQFPNHFKRFYFQSDLFIGENHQKDFEIPILDKKALETYRSMISNKRLIKQYLDKNAH